MGGRIRHWVTCSRAALRILGQRQLQPNLELEAEALALVDRCHADEWNKA